MYMEKFYLWFKSHKTVVYIFLNKTEDQMYAFHSAALRIFEHRSVMSKEHTSALSKVH